MPDIVNLVRPFRLKVSNHREDFLVGEFIAECWHDSAQFNTAFFNGYLFDFAVGVGQAGAEFGQPAFDLLDGIAVERSTVRGRKTCYN